MVSVVLRSQECLVDDIKCLESKLSDLQKRFDLVINWISSQYVDLIGLPEHIIHAVHGNQGEGRSNQCSNSFGTQEDIKPRIVNSDHNPPTTTEEIFHENVAAMPLSFDAEPYIKTEYNPLEDDHSGDGHESEDTSQTYIDEEVYNYLHVEYSTVNEVLRKDFKTERESEHDTIEKNRLAFKVKKQIGGEKRKSEAWRHAPRVKKCGKNVQLSRDKRLLLTASEYVEMTRSVAPKRLFCVVCHKTFPSPTQVRRHEVQVHLTKEDQSKVKLRNRTVRPKELVRDIFEEESSDFLPLEVTTTVEESPSSTAEAQEFIKESPSSDYRCAKCDAHFTNKRTYTSHIWRHCKESRGSKVEREFLCNQCGQSFKRKNTLDRHELAIHAKLRNFKCQYCEKTFSFSYLKTNHEKKHLGASKVTCDLCGFTFTCKATLKNHIRGLHENHRPHKCHLCDKSFKTSTARNYHVNTHGNPNGRKRGLNREIDPAIAAAKRRHCDTWKKHRVQELANLVTNNETTNEEQSNEEHSNDGAVATVVASED